MISQLYLKHKYTDCFIKLKDIDIVPPLNVKRTIFFLRNYTKTFSVSLGGSGLRVTKKNRKCKCFRVWIVNTDMPSEINSIRFQEHNLIALTEWDDKCENTNDPEKSAQICIDFSE